MDFLLSNTFVKYEVFMLIISLVYLAFGILFEIIKLIAKISSLVKPKRLILNDEEIKAQINNKLENMDSWIIEESPIIQDDEKIENPKPEEIKDIEQKEEILIEEKKDSIEQILTREEKDSILEIIRIVQNKISRWEYSDAKAKIIEWLSIDKFNKSLNILLASIYEKDKDYKKAEFIYKDLIVLNEHDTEVYLKLGFVLSIQKKYEVAYEIYKKLNSLDSSNIEAIEMLANLSHHLGKFEESKNFSKMFLKKTPRNVDILYLQALNFINLKERYEALEMLLKIKEMDPYNIRVNELIDKVTLEIELEKNFTNN